MELFVQVMFWLYLVSVLTRTLILSFADYSRTGNISVGRDCFELLITIAMLVWTARLLDYI